MFDVINVSVGYATMWLVMQMREQFRESFHPQTVEERESVRREIEVLLQSPHFTSSKRYPSFLRYIVEKALSGQGGSLKERTLGIEVFHRPPDYDTSNDTVVRFTAGEVRKRLALFYLESTSEHPIQILLPVGSYVPEFLHKVENGAETEATEATTQAGVLTEQISTTFGPRWRWLAGWRARAFLLLFGVMAAGGWVLLSHATGQEQPITQFWGPMENSTVPGLICMGTVVFSPTRPLGRAPATKYDDDTFVSLGTAVALGNVTDLFGQYRLKYIVQSASDVNLTELQAQPVILIGAYTNPWTLQLTNNLRFRFGPFSKQQIYDSQNPSVYWERAPAAPYTGPDDFAVVARYHDPVLNHIVVVIAGLGIPGTVSAAEFATSPKYLELLNNRLPRGWEEMNVEIVLKLKVVENQSGPPTILTTYVW